MVVSQDWISWQREHTDALQALQDAQRAYHRALSGAAFLGPEDATSEAVGNALQVMDAARMRLDDVRARQPQ